LEPEKLGERASKIAQEAKALLEVINKFGFGFEKRSRDAIRRSVMEDVEGIFQKVMHDVKKEKDEIERFPVLHSDEEVWVYAHHTRAHRPIYFLSVARMKRETAWMVAARLREEGAIYIPVETFKNLIQKLKNLILEGKMDEYIHLTVEQLIYDMTKKDNFS